MKEKIIKILRKYSDFDEDDHKESQEFNSMTGDFEKLINVEVEKRIAERMPSEEEIGNSVLDYCANPTEDGGVDFDQKQGYSFQCGVDWLRSRLTNPDNNLKQNSNGSAN